MVIHTSNSVSKNTRGSRTFKLILLLPWWEKRDQCLEQETGTQKTELWLTFA